MYKILFGNGNGSYIVQVGDGGDGTPLVRLFDTEERDGWIGPVHALGGLANHVDLGGFKKFEGDPRKVLAAFKKSLGEK